jgi:hypothetical protein
MYLFHIFGSFVPLRNPLGFGASDLIELGLALVAVIAVFAYAYLGTWFEQAARRTAWCMFALFLLPIALRLALLPRAPVPVATTSVEFSSLLLSDTLLDGRLANPPHPLPAFFDTPLVSQNPVYRSTLPIGDGLLLAAGQILFRSAWAGILLGIGALAALSYWMLRAWITPGWALCGGAIVACAFGPLSRWSNSYSGGFVAALGGCIVVGALPRLKQNHHSRSAAFWGNVAFSAGGLIVVLLASGSWFCLLTPILVLACILVLKRLKQFLPALLFVGGVFCAHFLFWYGMHSLAEKPALQAMSAYEARDFLNDPNAPLHRAVAEALQREPGKQLVFVRSGPWHSSGEWIHNRADMDASKIVWARDLGQDDDRKLLDYYRGRKAWLLEPDALPPRLRPYSESSAGFENVQ